MIPPGLEGLAEDGRPLVLFDLDRTLLVERTITHLAHRFEASDALERIWNEAPSQELAAGVAESRAVARLFEDTPYEAFRAACAEVAFRPDALETVRALQDLGLRVGVVSAGYTLATGRAAEELGLDLHVGVALVVEDGRLTGEIDPPVFPGPCGQHVCKETVLEQAAKATGAPFTVAVGDGQNDLCMIEAADLGIAIEPAHPRLREAADAVVDELGEVVGLVRGWRGR